MLPLGGAGDDKSGAATQVPVPVVAAHATVAAGAKMVMAVSEAQAAVEPTTAKPATDQQPEPQAQAAEESSRKPLDWQSLRRKEEELSRKEQALKELERELDFRLKKMNQMEANLKLMLDKADTVKDEKLRHLVDVYANMKAKQAAAALEQLQEDIAVRILSGMRGRQAGEVMSNMSAEKAATLSEALTRLQIPFAENQAQAN
jgi:flagellar motility protein MotE (MotC chaperone)